MKKVFIVLHTIKEYFIIILTEGTTPQQSCEVVICHSGLSGSFLEGFPTRFACWNDKQNKNFNPEAEHRGILLIKGRCVKW